MARKRTSCAKAAVVRKVATTAEVLEEGQCDYAAQTAATNAYNEALRAEELACNSVGTAEAALLDAQSVYDAAAASYEDAKTATDDAKTVVDDTFDEKRP